MYQPQSNKIFLIRAFKIGYGHWASSSGLPSGYNIEALFLILNSQQPDSTLYFECTGNNKNNFVSKDPNCEGQRNLANLGYIYNKPPGEFRTPLYRCYGSGDHMISTSANCEQRDIKNEGLLGYVYQV